MLTASSLRSLVRKRSRNRQWLLGVTRESPVPCLVFLDAHNGFGSDRGSACALFAMLPMLMGQLWPYSLAAVAYVYFLPCYLWA